MYRFFKSILFLLPPEKAHYLAMDLLQLAFRLGFSFLFKKQPNHPVTFCGLTFKNPVGLAAGFDKNAKWLDALSRLGFSHIEVGTVTPLPQPGNPKPRLFRLKKNHALINRMGFNNDGMNKMAIRLKNRPSDLIVGINIGKNKDTPQENAADDYQKCLQTLYPFGDYFVINVSSPNTAGLRGLQEKEPLRQIINKVQTARHSHMQEGHGRKPIMLKIAPDLNHSQVDDILDLYKETGLDALIVSNTTLDRDIPWKENHMNEQGGLSGKPLFQKSTEMLAYIHQNAPHVSLIGAGGVFNASDYQTKIASGATLVQVYTGFIYEGPGIVKKLLA